MIGHFYDFTRYIKYSGWNENFNNKDIRGYKSVMTYHSLEKSLSYEKRNNNHGWNTAFQALDMAKSFKDSKVGFFDQKLIYSLSNFVNHPSNKIHKNAIIIKNELLKNKIFEPKDNLTIQMSKEDFHKGMLDNPKEFFESRYSLREFSNQIVDESEIKKAIKLAMKTPSVCNRQEWHIYHTSDEDVKQTALSYQSGNKPFGKNIPNLLIVTTDLNAFFSSNERYQNWIDGGLISMSIIYALHSLGIASCPLNWSQFPSVDIAFRKKIKIKSNHNIIMFIAAGYPKESNQVCSSDRKNVDDIYSKIDLKNEKK